MSRDEVTDADQVVWAIGQAAGKIAESITPNAGGTIRSLTEAVMGITVSLCRVATALESIADAIRQSRSPS